MEYKIEEMTLYSGKVLTKEAHDRFQFMTLTDQGLSLVATQYGVNYG